MSKGFHTVDLHACASAAIPTPAIGQNGNWYVGNDDTGVKAGITSDLDQRLADLEAKYEQINSDLAIIDYTDQVTAYYDFHANGPLKVVRSGHFVHIFFGTVQTNSFAANTQYKILQLPAEARPTEYLRVLSTCGKVADGAYYDATASIDNNGNVYCCPGITSNYLYLNTVYYIG